MKLTQNNRHVRENAARERWTDRNREDAADILEDAADLIGGGHWTKGALTAWKGKTCYCALGAIMQVCYGEPDERRSGELAGEQLANQALSLQVYQPEAWPGTYIATFNDKTARDANEVQRAMLMAARNIRSAINA